MFRHATISLNLQPYVVDYSTGNHIFQLVIFLKRKYLHKIVIFNPDNEIRLYHQHHFD